VSRKGLTIVCGPSDCPYDENFEHDNYYGCVPKDFSPSAGWSKTYSQKRNAELGRYLWNGGCDAAGVGRRWEGVNDDSSS
jgi:hypothetical protein